MQGRRRAGRSARGRQLETRSGGGLAMAVEAPTAAEGAGGDRGLGEEEPPGVVFVKRGLIAKCLTCPICRKLFRDATTICECLHTFCRKCIYDKIDEEELDCCPVCNIYLGVVPEDKLRPDHSLQDVRAKLFPFKRRKVETSEAPPTTLPARRKEISLSSLVVSTPQVAPSNLAGRRTKVVTRRTVCSHGSSPAINGTNEKDDDKIDKISSTENTCKLAPNKRKIFSNAEPSVSTPSKDADRCEESFQKDGLWKPLSHLLEIANRTKSSKSTTPQSPKTKADQTNDPDKQGVSRRTRTKDHLSKSKVQDDSNDSAEAPSVTGKAKSLGRKRKEGPNSAQALLDAASTQSDRRTSPIWFSLIASYDQSGDPPLPQIPVSYLRIKDVSVPVSFIQKYLVAKLNLASESEVEVTCRGQPVNPSMSLQNLVEQWLKGGPSHKLQATVGTSGKEFVMVLAYGRRKASAQ